MTSPIDRDWTVKTAHREIPQHDPISGDFVGVTEVMGGVVHDHARDVVYRVTIGRRPNTGDATGSPVYLTSITITPQDGSPVDSDTLRRVPTQSLADAVAVAYAREAFLEYGGDEVPDVPTSAEIERMLKSGETRHTIAARYARSPSTVSDWIGKAYRERPDTMPPRQRPGRGKKNTSKKEQKK